ncbi:MAG: transporter [Sphingomonadales bacterium]
MIAASLLVAGALASPQVLAQVPGRFYLQNLEGGNGVPLIFNSLTGNSNPFDPSQQVTPGASFDATMAIMGYAHTFALGDRSAMAAVILPMGRISGDASLAGRTAGQSASGFGDPTLEFTVNVIGPKVQRNIPDVIRYEPGFSLNLLADLALPIGEYNSDQALNIGQNRWYGRLGAPIVWQIGDWVPGRRTTLEFLPAVWLFGNNTDYAGGQTLKTDPLFQLDVHLTRDFTPSFWGALDFVWYKGGQATINGVAASKLDNVGGGLTLGYTINDNLTLTAGYKSTFNSSSPGELRMDGLMISLTYGWHPLIEGMKRLK